MTNDEILALAKLTGVTDAYEYGEPIPDAYLLSFAQQILLKREAEEERTSYLTAKRNFEQECG